MDLTKPRRYRILSVMEQRKAGHAMIRRTACLIARDSDPYRNQAIEQHLLDTLPEETAILYLWRNRRTVMVGRCQNPWYVCSVERFTDGGGTVARRLSGGGAMVQDEGCVGVTLIVPKTEWDIARQSALLGMAAGAFGVQAESAPRCGLSAAGRRFCDCAFFKGGAAAMHQGTLMVQAGLGALEKALEVEEGKLPPALRQPGPGYVNLGDLNRRATPEALMEALYWAFGRLYGARPATLDERMLDGASLARLTGRFASREWVLPQSEPYTFSVAERFPWGGVAVQLMAEGGVIRAARIFTDAMEAALFSRIESALVGAPFLISAISGRFSQRLTWMGAPRLNQITGDVCTLICGRIRAMDRGGGKE